MLFPLSSAPRIDKADECVWQYNFVTSAAFSCAVAISGIVIFFALQISDIELNWWGNSVVGEGCDGSGGCVLKVLPEGEYFGARIGEFH